MMNRTPTNRGFTLIEMLVAVSISAVAVGIAVPVASQIYNNLQTVGFANQVAFEVGRARMQAIAQGRTVRVVSDGHRVCRQSSTGSSGGTWEPASCGEGQSLFIPKGVSVGIGAPIQFDRNGLAATVSSVSISGNKVSKTIEINMIGRTEIL